MKTHTTPTGIELLMPLVPKEDCHEFKINRAGRFVMLYFRGKPNVNAPGQDNRIWWPFGIIYEDKSQKQEFTILGTCWYEGNHKFVCKDFDPAEYGFIDFPFQDSLRSEGITIPEGQKLVLIRKD